VGPGERFEAVYRACAGAVQAYVLRRARRDEVDDVVAEVFLVAWRRLDDVPEDPLPWLLGVGRRVLANRRRGHARELALHSKLRVLDAAAVSSEWPLADPDDRVLAVLGGLSAADQEVLLLVTWEGLEPARAARVLGIRTGAFLMRLHRARRRFARALAQSPRTAQSDAASTDTQEVVR
jgi:DNA-directed RNA polymerase specialized sigma24 family protein